VQYFVTFLKDKATARQTREEVS